MAVAGGEFCLEVERLAASQKQCAQDGLVRFRGQGGSGSGGDLFGDHVCLLGSDAALLDWEAGDVPGRVDVNQFLNPTSVAMNPLPSCGTPSIGFPLRAVQAPPPDQRPANCRVSSKRPCATDTG